VSEVQVYLADLEQRQLVPLISEDDRDKEVAAALPVDGTLAGRAYQTVTIAASRAGDAHQLWIPLVDGTERLGVLGLVVADVSQAMLDRYRTLASLARPARALFPCASCRYGGHPQADLTRPS
jgi:hypothetical protein